MGVERRIDVVERRLGGLRVLLHDLAPLGQQCRDRDQPEREGQHQRGQPQAVQFHPEGGPPPGSGRRGEQKAQQQECLQEEVQAGEHACLAEHAHEEARIAGRVQIREPGQLRRQWPGGSSRARRFAVRGGRSLRLSRAPAGKHAVPRSRAVSPDRAVRAARAVLARAVQARAIVPARAVLLGRVPLPGGVRSRGRTGGGAGVFACRLCLRGRSAGGLSALERVSPGGAWSGGAWSAAHCPAAACSAAARTARSAPRAGMMRTWARPAAGAVRGPDSNPPGSRAGGIAGFAGRPQLPQNASPAKSPSPHPTHFSHIGQSFARSGIIGHVARRSAAPHVTYQLCE